MKIQNALVSNIFDRSQRYFARVTTVTLSWRVQIFFYTRVFWIFIEFRIRSKYAKWDGRQVWGTMLLPHWYHKNLVAILQMAFLNLFLYEIWFIFIQISLTSARSSPIDYTPASIQIIGWHWTGDKLLSKPNWSNLTQSFLPLYVVVKLISKLLWLFAHSL